MKDHHKTFLHFFCNCEGFLYQCNTIQENVKLLFVRAQSNMGLQYRF